MRKYSGHVTSAELLRVTLLFVALIVMAAGRILFTRGGKYHTPARARVFWIVWGIIVSGLVIVLMIEVLTGTL